MTLKQIRTWARKTTSGRIATWVAIAVAGTLITLGVTTLVMWTVRLVNPSPPGLEAQLEKIIRSNGLKGSQLAYSASLDFRGTGRQSRVLVFRDFNRSDIRGFSDQLQIYDLNHGRLQLAFSFRPVAQIPDGTRTASITCSVDLLAGGDLNKDGRAELVASFTELYVDGVSAHPVAITWSPAKDNYVVTPLLNDRYQILGDPSQYPAAALLKALSKSTAGSYQTKYLNLANIIDPASRAHIKTLGGETFALIPGRPPTLIGAFVVGAGECYQCVSRIQVLAWSVDFAAKSPEVYPCYALGSKRLLVSVPSNGDFSGVLARRWRSTDGRCA